MKIIILLIIFLSVGGVSVDTSVYICNSATAKKYHLRSNCRGLSNCQSKVVKVTLDKAKKDGKTLCGWED